MLPKKIEGMITPATIKRLQAEGVQVVRTEDGQVYLHGPYGQSLGPFHVIDPKDAPAKTIVIGTTEPKSADSVGNPCKDCGQTVYTSVDAPTQFPRQCPECAGKEAGYGGEAGLIRAMGAFDESEGEEGWRN